MKNVEYKWGIYPERYKDLRQLSFALHIVFGKEEKYIEVEFIYWAVAIGKMAV
jgi:hypothetical protein